jgi:hypothetical protein
MFLLRVVVVVVEVKFDARHLPNGKNGSNKDVAEINKMLPEINKMLLIAKISSAAGVVLK